MVACAEETRHDLLALLSAEAGAGLAGWTRVEAHASGDELLTSVVPILERHHDGQELELLTRWRDALGRSGRAAAGWSPTLDAVSDGRVDVLLHLPGVSEDVRRCPACGRLQLDGGSCALDGEELEQCGDGLDAVVHKTLAFGGRGRAITSRDDLAEVGGLGALLRF